MEVSWIEESELREMLERVDAESQESGAPVALAHWRPRHWHRGVEIFHVESCVLATVPLPCRAGLIFLRRRSESEARQRRGRERKRKERRGE
jgi:hypothetical protein